MFQFFNKITKESPLLAYTGIIQLLLAVFFLFYMSFDPRELLGINVWIKPIKFLISGGIYLTTMAWVVQYLKEYPRKQKLYSFSFSIAMSVEMICIIVQAIRGERSHFNETSPLNGIIFSLMGMFILYNTVILFLMMLDFFRKKIEIQPDMLWAIRLGLILILLASLEGGLLVANKAHTVGAADGGPGLWFLNWSTKFGDLRVSHFIGMHGIQLLPLTAYLLASMKQSASLRKRILYMEAGFILLLMFITIIQALNQMPFLSI